MRNGALLPVPSLEAAAARQRSGGQKKSPAVVRQPGTPRTAATYSPNWWVSTIGDGELNFSVRNGKRWILTAITTAVFYLRENINSENLPVHWINSQTFSLCLRFRVLP